METIKRQLEIMKLNMRISRIKSELNSPVMFLHPHDGGTQPAYFREDEKSFILRESVNELIDRRDMLKGK